MACHKVALQPVNCGTLDWQKRRCNKTAIEQGQWLASAASPGPGQTTPSNLMCSAASEYITNDSRRRPEREWPREREREPDVAIMCEEKRRLAGCGWPGCCHWNVKNPNLCHTQSIVHNHHTWETVCPDCWKVPTSSMTPGDKLG